MKVPLVQRLIYYFSDNSNNDREATQQENMDSGDTPELHVQDETMYPDRYDEEINATPTVVKSKT